MGFPFFCAGGGLGEGARPVALLHPVVPLVAPVLAPSDLLCYLPFLRVKVPGERILRSVLRDT